MPIAIFDTPIPVKTIHGEGYVLYVESSGMFDNDVWTVCLCDGGKVKHYTTAQINVSKNSTFNINECKEGQKAPKDSQSNSDEQSSNNAR